MKYFIKTILLTMLFTNAIFAQVKRELSFKKQEIAYKVLNPNNKNLIILTHGLGDATSSFSSILGDLEMLPYKIITFDLPGCGINFDKTFFFDDYPAIINGLIKKEASNKAKTILIGHSMGGLVSLIAYGQNKKIDNIIVVEASITTADKNFFKYVQEPPIGIGFEKFIKPTSHDNGYITTYRENLSNSNPVVIKENIKTVFENFEANQKRIFTTGKPFVYIYGNKSSEPTLRQKLADYPFITVKSFDNAQHWVHIDAHDEFITYIKDLLK